MTDSEMSQGRARRRALDFRWEGVAERTALEYTKRLAGLRERSR